MRAHNLFFMRQLRVNQSIFKSSIKYVSLVVKESSHLGLQGVPGRVCELLTVRCCHGLGIGPGPDLQPADDDIIHAGVLFQVCYMAFQTNSPLLFFLVLSFQIFNYFYHVMTIFCCLETVESSSNMKSNALFYPSLFLPCFSVAF